MSISDHRCSVIALWAEHIIIEEIVHINKYIVGWENLGNILKSPGSPAEYNI
jgi:hypothetical protein